MTTNVTVSVNGNYKIPVKIGEEVTWVSGRDSDGPRAQTFHPVHGGGEVIVIGPEEPDTGEAPKPPLE